MQKLWARNSHIHSEYQHKEKKPRKEHVCLNFACSEIISRSKKKSLQWLCTPLSSLGYVTLNISKLYLCRKEKIRFKRNSFNFLFEVTLLLLTFLRRLVYLYSESFTSFDRSSFDRLKSSLSFQLFCCKDNVSKLSVTSVTSRPLLESLIYQIFLFSKYSLNYFQRVTTSKQLKKGFPCSLKVHTRNRDGVSDMLIRNLLSDFILFMPRV